MAFLDNPAIILAHIRQSHVTSDDTGMCEMVLIDQDVDLEKCQLTLVPGSSCGSTGSGSLSEGGSSLTDNHACDLSQSMDITSSWDFGIRRRSNTGRRISRLWLVSRAGFLSGTPVIVASQKACSAVVFEGACVSNLGQWSSDAKVKLCAKEHYCRITGKHGDRLQFTVIIYSCYEVSSTKDGNQELVPNDQIHHNPMHLSLSSNHWKSRLPWYTFFTSGCKVDHKNIYIANGYAVSSPDLRNVMVQSVMLPVCDILLTRTRNSV